MYMLSGGVRGSGCEGKRRASAACGGKRSCEGGRRRVRLQRQAAAPSTGGAGDTGGKRRARRPAVREGERVRRRDGGYGRGGGRRDGGGGRGGEEARRGERWGRRRERRPAASAGERGEAVGRANGRRGTSPAVLAALDLDLLSDELIRLAQAGEHIWSKSPGGGVSGGDARETLNVDTYDSIFSKPGGSYRAPSINVEESRESGLVLMSTVALADVFMDTVIKLFHATSISHLAHE
uniref:START domain-containing protein n=1 Tax=Oryza meridionalis TaxID=40149 RepID=A0A0E0CUY5_9ORYZ